MIAAAQHARVMTARRDEHDEVEEEPIPGLPEELPDGEDLLWQGRPEWRRLARDAFHVRGLALYLGAAAMARGVSFVLEGSEITGALMAVLEVMPLAVTAIGIAYALAWLHARSTVYSITSRRIVMRIGVALPITFNLPFKQLASAASRTNPDGTGDICVQLAGNNRLGWIFLWPHTRPWRYARAEPMLRSLREASVVSSLLGDAVRRALTEQPRSTLAPIHAEASSSEEGLAL